MSRRQTTIEAEIARTKKALSELEHMHPGSLSKQKRSRGGEYYQLSFSHRGKGHTMYVRPEDVPGITRELENYRTFRSLTRRWIDLEIKLAKLRRSSSPGSGQIPKKQKEAG
jgi:hypothetical protein